MGCSLGKQRVQVGCVVPLPAAPLIESVQSPCVGPVRRSNSHSLTVEREQVNNSKARSAPRLLSIQASSLLARRHSTPHSTSPLPDLPRPSA